MSTTIARATCKFRYAFSTPQQLTEFFAANPSIVGVVAAGRSNVGKSSLINALFKKDLAKTSKTPGRTRSINVFEFQLTDEERKYVLFDIPGYGHAQVSAQEQKSWNTLLALFFEMISQRVLVLHLQDARHPMQSADKRFLHFFQNYPLRSFLVLNKIDKLKKQKEKVALKKLLKKMIEQKELPHEQIYQVSAVEKTALAPLEQSLVSFFLMHQ